MTGPLGVGIIGCGGFARGVHVPNILKNPKYRIIATADVNEEAAEALKRETRAEYHTVEADDMLDDKNIDVVFITTRHDSHAELSIKSAERGKHLLCEKPMGLNYRECRRVSEAVRKSGVKYTIGYNRGLAPMVLKAKELLAGGDDRIMASHRMQNPLPPAHWLLDAGIGGGRITGEGCHVFDMLCGIMNSAPVRVYASGGRFLKDSIDPYDSAQILITFRDGSTGAAMLMSSGSAYFPKEATEIYAGGKSVYINNFKEMVYCGFEGKATVTISYEPGDKGQALEIDLLAEAIINDSPAPNGPEQAARAAVIGFKAVESMESGKPVDISEEEYKF